MLFRSYTVVNNTDQPVTVVMSVLIAKYRDGKWHRLPKSKKYDETYFYASMVSEKCPAGGTKTQEFSLSLPDMAGEKLTPEKYRLEKELSFDWYFAEFEVIE